MRCIAVLAVCTVAAAFKALSSGGVAATLQYPNLEPSVATMHTSKTLQFHNSFLHEWFSARDKQIKDKYAECREWKNKADALPVDGQPSQLAEKCQKQAEALEVKLAEDVALVEKWERREEELSLQEAQDAHKLVRRCYYRFLSPEQRTSLNAIIDGVVISNFDTECTAASEFAEFARLLLFLRMRRAQDHPEQGPAPRHARRRGRPRGRQPVDHLLPEGETGAGRGRRLC